jgi:PPM family protein phosphatase
MFVMEYYGASDRGTIRENNEDYLHTEEGFFIVADGMGGHRAGEVASTLSVEFFLKAFDSSRKGLNNKTARKALLDSIISANYQVYKRSLNNPDYYGMGTTFTACLIIGNKAHFVHVGDSRAYIYRNSSLELLTSDHTFVGEMFRRGEITYEETFDHPQRNYLTNVLGVAEDIKPDYISFDTEKGDMFLLCSDGLNSMLRDNEIAEVLKRYPDISESAKKLIRSAITKGGNDNITVIIVKI